MEFEPKQVLEGCGHRQGSHLSLMKSVKVLADFVGSNPTASGGGLVTG